MILFCQQIGKLIFAEKDPENKTACKRTLKQESPKGPGSLTWEKVKGHSGAIYRRPLMLYTKYQGSSQILQEDL